MFSIASANLAASMRPHCRAVSAALAAASTPSGRIALACAILVGHACLAFGTRSEQPWFDRSTPSDRGTLNELPAPIPVRLRLADGGVITGTVSMWGDEGVAGSIGFRAWTELHAIEAWRLFTRVMNREQVDQWILLGRTMLLVDGGAGMAEGAFATARRLDSECGPAIAAARSEAAARIAERQRAADAGIAADRLRLDPPHWAQWPATPWPALDPEASADANFRVRENAAQLLALVGLSLEPVRTDSLLLYLSGDRTDSARLAVRLEGVRARLAARLGTTSALLAPHGRVAVIVVDDREDFRSIQQRVFLRIDRPEVRAAAHFVGPQVFVVAHRGADGPELEIALAEQLVHAFLHRYVSPRRLPPWAAEGLALSVAAETVPAVQMPVNQRRRALRLIRDGHDPTPLIAADYGASTWPGPEQLGPTVGRLLVELLVADQPEAFGRWVVDVKSGEPWPAAMQTRFRSSPARIVQAFVRHHRLRD